MKYIRGIDGKILAVVQTSLLGEESNSLFVTPSEARGVMEALRSLPPRVITVRVSYPLIDVYDVAINKGANMLDMMNELQKAGLDIGKTESDFEAELEHSVFVAPCPDSLPDDGYLTYKVVTNVWDFKDVTPGTVLLFDESRLPLLEFFVASKDVFGVTPISLSGLPVALYSADYERAVWPCRKASYQTLTADLAAARHNAEILEDELRTVRDVEVDRVSTKTGAIRGLVDVGVHAVLEDEDVGIADDVVSM